MEERRRLVEEIEKKYAAEFEEINHFIFEKAELGLEEFESSKYLSSYMEGKGFSVEIPYCGLETAFAAVKGNCGPKIVFLAEYDALPGVGPNNRNGHACGHNWIAAATTGAAVVLAEICDVLEIDARIALIGTPAEETYGAKVEMCKKHAFDDVDLCVQPHLEAYNSVTAHGLAMTAVQCDYSGKSAHASARPWEGVNALDAVQLTFAGVNALRQHIRPDARIHGIVTEGGSAPNVVPDKAGALFYVRAATRKYADELVAKLLNVAKGAELMTGAVLQIGYPELPMDDILRIPVLQKLMDENLRKEDIIPNLTDAEAAENAGSSDIGNVSHVCPTMYVEVGLDSPEPFSCHTQSALSLADSHWAYAKLHQIIRVIVNMSVDALENPGYLSQAREELGQRI